MNPFYCFDLKNEMVKSSCSPSIPAVEELTIGRKHGAGKSAPGQRVNVPLAQSAEDLQPLHRRCHEGRMFDVEGRINDGKPLQLVPRRKSKGMTKTGYGAGIYWAEWT